MTTDNQIQAQEQARFVEFLFNRATQIQVQNPDDDALDIITEALEENDKLHMMCSRLEASIYRASAWKQIHAK